MDDEIEVQIKTVLPGVEDALLKNIKDCLNDLGVTKSSELILVEEEDLKGVVKTIQARLLVRSWKNMENVQEKSLDSSSIPNNEMKVAETPKNKSTANLDWALNYSIPWKKLPGEIVKPLEEGKRLTPALRRKLVRVVTDDIAKNVEKPGKSALSIIARTMIDKYPESLADKFGEEVVGEGHSSILRQMSTRFENLNRVSPYNILKRAVKNNKDDKKISSSDAYGCVNWQPALLPIGEDEDTQSEKKNKMIEHVSTRTVNATSFKYFEETYFSQRKDINIKTSIIDLKASWPLLFTEKGLNNHFKKLMEFEASEKVNETLSTKYSRIFGFFKSITGSKKGEKKIREILKDNARADNPDIMTMLTLICAYFEETMEELVLAVDVNVTVDDLNMNLPSTPCLVCYGEDVTNSETYAIAIDNKVVIEEIRTFDAGFTLMFISFYVFNIKYPKSAAITLEFVQRCFFGINPNRGRKVNTDAKRKEIINNKILHLLNKISEYDLLYN